MAAPSACVRAPLSSKPKFVQQVWPASPVPLSQRNQTRPDGAIDVDLALTCLTGRSKQRDGTISIRIGSAASVCVAFLTLHRSTPVGTIICLQDDAARLSIPHSKLLFVASILSAIDVVRICSPDRFTWQQSTRVFRALKLLHRTIKRSRHQFVQPLPTAQDAISSQRVIPDPVVFESESPSVAAGAGDRTARERMSLCQSVIQMFMSVPTRLITVDEMSRWLVKVPLPTRTHTQICSCESAIAEFTHRVRVLWDTVNVLRELELIEQISYPRKQFQWFRWVGADIYPLATKVGIDLEYEVPSWRRLRLLESISSVDLTSHAAVGSPSSSLAVQAESQTESLSSDEPPKKKSRTETE